MIDEIFWLKAKEIFEILSLDVESEELKYLCCALCKKVMIDACQIICGCLFCRLCFERYLSTGSNKCPSNIWEECHKVVINSMDDVHSEKDVNSKIINLIVSCPTGGCDFKGDVKKLIDHWDSCKSNKDKSESVSEITECQVVEKKSHPKQDSSIESLCLKVNNLKKKNKKLEKTIQDMNLRINDLEEDRRKFEPFHNILLTSVSAVQDEIEKLQFKPYVWIVDQFTQYKKNQECIYSEPFFAFKCGYKMRLCLYSNGAYNDRYVSVYFELIRGEYDLLLEWPFRYNVILTLLNQHGGEDHSHTIHYLLHKDRSYVYGRPSTPSNVPFGASEFIEYSRLDSFLKNDMLFLSCSVVKSPTKIAFEDC